jgi:hypothetical protein
MQKIQTINERDKPLVPPRTMVKVVTADSNFTGVLLSPELKFNIFLLFFCANVTPLLHKMELISKVSRHLKRLTKGITLAKKIHKNTQKFSLRGNRTPVKLTCAVANLVIDWGTRCFSRIK